MHLPIQLCGLLLYAFLSTASTQERERVWHSTTPGPVSLSTTPGVPPAEPESVVAEPAGDSRPVIHEKVLAPTESTIPTPQPSAARDFKISEDVLTRQEITAPEETNKEEPLFAVEDKKEKKERKWMSAPIEETKKTKEEEKIPKEVNNGKIVENGKESETESIEESQNIAAEITDEEVTPDKKKKTPRKWMSVPGMVIEDPAEMPTETIMPPTEAFVPPTEKDLSTAKESLELAHQAIEDHPLNPSELSIGNEVDKYSINALDLELPVNISELLLAAEEGIPLVQETIISKKTTVYVTISDTLDAEPLFVNLTGIRHYTGQERRVIGGCLDLSDLMLTGEEAKEVILRMSKHKFHKLDLSNNNITEFPANTFSPVAFTVRELRLDGNPLASNDQGEASVLQRGGLFHLTELRELNLSSCGLQDMDYFTPWNSNHMEVVDLSNNKLSTVPSNLQFFHKIKKLFLDGNPITMVTELPFALLWNMQILSLADCHVATIVDDPFRNMDKLKEISLEGNNLTQIANVRLPRSNSAVKMFLSGNPWHCACEMLNFIEHYHYAIRDIEYIRCASPRWLEGLRTAYLTKEILSLDSVDGDCTPQTPRVSSTHMPMPTYSPTLRADRLQLLALIVFVLAALFMLCHVLWARKKDKYRFEDDRDDIHYIRIEKKPNFK